MDIRAPSDDTFCSDAHRLGAWHRRSARRARLWEEDLDAKVEATAGQHGSARDVISVRRLSLKYGRGASGVLALSDISFSVGDGEFIAVVGPSGCGKSTLLKILAGLLPQTEGEANLKGTADQGPAPRHRRGVPVAGAVSLAQRARQRDAAGRRAAPRPGRDEKARARPHQAGRPRRASRTATRASCRAACSSASASCAR